jgi:ech hydrogenase subunit D
MSPEQTFEIIPVETLLVRVRELDAKKWRLVQIGATRLPEQFEITYSFGFHLQLVNLRIQLPADQARVPSISSVYWGAILYENEMHDLFNIQVDGIAVDFKGTLYKTAVPFAFGTTKIPAPPAPKPAAPAAPATPAAPASSTAS